MLIERGADVNRCSDLNETPLFLAADEGNDKCVHILLNSGADTLVRDNMGLTACDIARMNGHEVIAKMIEDFVNEHNYQGYGLRVTGRVY